MAMEKVWLRGREKEGSELSKSRGASGGHEHWGQGIETKKQRDAALV